MKFRSILALALALAFTPALAQNNQGTAPLTIAKGGTAAGTAPIAWINLAPTLGANTVLGSIAGGTPAALNQAQITSLINAATASLSGAVPAWPNNTSTFYRGDGTYSGTINGLIVSAAGSAATPTGLIFSTCGATCGWYAPAANQVAFSQGGVIKLDWNIGTAGRWTFYADLAANGNRYTGATAFGFNTGYTIAAAGANTIQFGGTDSATPSPDLVFTQNVLAGTSNTAGTNWTLRGSLSTGSGASGDIIFQTGGTGAGATVQNTAATAMKLKGATQLVELNAAAYANCNILATVSNVVGCVTTGTGVATALGNALNASGGLVGFSGNIGAASGTSLGLGGCTVLNVWCFQGAGYILSSNALAFTVGPNGQTNPTLNVDGSVASSATGVNIKGAAAGAGAFVAALSSGTNEGLHINAKGNAPVTIGDVSTGGLTVQGAFTAPGAVTNADLQTMAANTVKANATGGVAAPTDVTPATARSASLLNVDQFTGHGDSIYTILATDRTVGTNAAFTASRTWTLPAANAVNAGQDLIIADFQGTVTGTNTLVISRAGADTVNGGTSVTITAANGAYLLRSDGSSKWTAQALGAAAGGGVSSVTCGTGLSGGTITTSGTCAIDFTRANTWTGAQTFNSHILSTGPAPTISGAGCSVAASSSDTGGVLTAANGAANTCTITFGTAYAVTPACTFSGNDTPGNFYPFISTQSNSAITLNFAGVSVTSHIVNYVCIGRT